MLAFRFLSLLIILVLPNFGLAQAPNCVYEGFPVIIQGNIQVCDRGHLRQYKVFEILRLREASERLGRAMVPILSLVSLEALREKSVTEPNAAFLINATTVNTNGYGIVTFGSDLTLATAESLRPGDIPFAMQSLMAYEQRSGN